MIVQTKRPGTNVYLGDCIVNSQGEYRQPDPKPEEFKSPEKQTEPKKLPPLSQDGKKWLKEIYKAPEVL